MQFFRKIIFVCKVILALLLIAFGIYFALINNQNIGLELLFFSVPSINVGLLVIIAVFCGVFLGIILASISNIFNNKSNNSS